MTWPSSSRSQPSCDAEIVGRILADGEEDLVGVELHPVVEASRQWIDAPSRHTRMIGSMSTGMFSASSLSQYSGRSRSAGSPFVQMMMSRVQVVRLSAMPTARRPLPMTTTFLSRALVAVAVGADVRVGAVDVLEPGDVGPDVANADREQQTRARSHAAHRRAAAARTRRRRTLLDAPRRRCVDQLDAVASRHSSRPRPRSSARTDARRARGSH